MALPYFGFGAGTPLGDILQQVAPPPPKVGVPERTAAIGAAAIEFIATAPAAPAAPAGGGITVKPWWDIWPATPTEAVSRAIETPIVSPAGGAAVVLKSITKQTGAKFVPLALAAGGGFLLSRLFGGGSQELQQAQEITQLPEVTVTPEQTTPVTVDPILNFLQKIFTTISPAAGAEIEIGAGADVFGDVGTTSQITQTYTYPTTYNIQKTLTETYPTQITKTTTITQAGQEQEATQEQGTDWIMIAVVGVLGLIGYSMFKKKSA